PRRAAARHRTRATIDTARSGPSLTARSRRASRQVSRRTWSKPPTSRGSGLVVSAGGPAPLPGPPIEAFEITVGAPRLSTHDGRGGNARLLRRRSGGRNPP